MGVPTARPVPLEEFRKHAVAMDRDHRGSRAVSQLVRAARRRSAAVALSRLADQSRIRRVRHPARGLAADPEDARSGACRRAPREVHFNDAYWTVAQMVAHHTVNGCNLQSGDLFGTGTLSGPDANQAGSLLELSQGGKKPIHLANGETRTFLEDGDCIVLRGYCERNDARRIGFGECRGTVLPARSHR